MTDSVLQISITNIQPNPKQPRQIFDEDELQQLAASIKEHGVIQPLIVCPPDTCGVYMLIAGERRLRAAQRARLETVPVIVRTISGEDDLLVLAVIENVNREEMSPVEEGDAYLQLKNKGWSNTRIAKAVGVNDVRVGHCLNCALLPKATRALIQTGELFTSNKFIGTLKEIADIESTACDDLALELVRASPSLRAANKSAKGVLAYLRNIKGTDKAQHKHKLPIFEIASSIVKLELSDNEQQAPPQWDLLRQAGMVPPWNMLAQAAMQVCGKCELRDIASSVMCSACTAAQMLVSLTSLAEVQKV